MRRGAIDNGAYDRYSESRIINSTDEQTLTGSKILACPASKQTQAAILITDAANSETHTVDEHHEASIDIHTDNESGVHRERSCAV